MHICPVEIGLALAAVPAIGWACAKCGALIRRLKVLVDNRF